MRRAVLVLLAMTSVAGCSYLDDLRMRGVPEGSSSWRFGYADGCQNGRHDAATRKQFDKDVERYRSDDEYREGWQTGYRECLAEAQREAAAPRPTPVAEAAAPAVAVASPAAPSAPEPPQPAPAAAVSSPVVATPAVVADTATTPLPASNASRRRAEIEARLKQLRGEIQSLEAELGQLPK